MKYYKIGDKVSFTKAEYQPDIGTIITLEDVYLRISYTDGSFRGVHMNESDDITLVSRKQVRRG